MELSQVAIAVLLLLMAMFSPSFQEKIPSIETKKDKIELEKNLNVTMNIPHSYPSVSGWFTGPNVCAEYDQSITQSTENFEDSIQCSGDSKKFYCIQSYVNERKAYITRLNYECCQGFKRPKHGSSGCIRIVRRKIRPGERFKIKDEEKTKLKATDLRAKVV